jgi:hypothetical protein
MLQQLLSSSSILHGAALPRRVRLVGVPIQVYPFETRRPGEARSGPPRSVGLTCLTLADGGLHALGPPEAVALCRRFYRETRSPEAAREKVIFCDGQGDTLVYQADVPNRSAALCTCGNATGASAAMLAHCLQRRRVRQKVQLPDGQVELWSEVVPAGDGGWHVEQSWSGIQVTTLQVRLRERPIAVCTGSFNDYLIVSLADRAELEAFGLDEVLALWHAARAHFASTSFASLLRCRLAAVAPDGPRPFVKFYTCGRLHPGAPLTGLAALAVTAGHVDWLADLLSPGQIEHRRGVDALPAVCATPTATHIGFSAIHVLLHGA